MAHYRNGILEADFWVDDTKGWNLFGGRVESMQQRQIEIDQNYDWFQRNIAKFLADHKGQFAVLRHQSVDAFFDGPGEALRAALKKFPDGVFSIQEVVDEPLDLGFLSIATH